LRRAEHTRSDRVAARRSGTTVFSGLGMVSLRGLDEHR
jgi:hypothetical protein